MLCLENSLLEALSKATFYLSICIELFGTCRIFRREQRLFRDGAFLDYRRQIDI